MAADVALRCDDIEAVWINPLNNFLMAGTPHEATQVLARHPQLMSAKALSIIDKFIVDACRKGDSTERQHLEERRELLQNYRAALGLLSPPPPLPPLPQLPQPPPRRRWPLLLAAVVIILAVGVATAMIALRSPLPVLPPVMARIPPILRPLATRRTAGGGQPVRAPAQSAVDRSSIQNAVSDVSQCAPTWPRTPRPCWTLPPHASRSSPSWRIFLIVPPSLHR